MEIDEEVMTFFDGICHKCGDRGHKARDCPKGQGKRKDVFVVVGQHT